MSQVNINSMPNEVVRMFFDHLSRKQRKAVARVSWIWSYLVASFPSNALLSPLPLYPVRVYRYADPAKPVIGIKGIDYRGEPYFTYQQRDILMRERHHSWAELEQFDNIFEKISKINSLYIDKCGGKIERVCDLLNNNKLEYLETDSEQVKKLAQALENNESLIHLSVEDNEIDADAAEIIANMLRIKTELCELDLLGKMNSKGADAIAAALTVNQTLTRLNISNIGIGNGNKFINALKFNNSLTHLNISIYFDDEDPSLLSEALKTNRSLTYLNICNNNSFGDAGCSQLAEALKTNHSLTHLVIYRNEISDEGGKKLIAALHKNKSLSSLDMRMNNLSDEIATQLIEVWKFTLRNPNKLMV